MSQNSCCVPRCAVVRKDGVPLHLFPNPETSAEKFKTWILNIGGEIAILDNHTIYDNKRVCHRHFEEIHKYPTGRLSKLAIPTLNIPDLQAQSLGEAMVVPTSDISQRNQLQGSDYDISGPRVALEHKEFKADLKKLRKCESDKKSFNAKYMIAKKMKTTTAFIMGVAESCADAGDSSPVQEPRVDNTDICDGGDNDADDDSDTLVESNVCRVCLALDVKLYDLKDIALRETFQNITGIAVTENNHPILERLCWECAGRLRAAAAFRNKALLSDALLQRIASTGEHIRKDYITLIKEHEDYLKSAATLSIVEVFHTVEIDPDNESLPFLTENNETKIVENTREDSIKLKESIVEENNGEMDSEDESIIEAPIETEVEYNRNIVLETNSLVNRFIVNIPREQTINPAYSSPLPGCSHVEPKYTILGYLPNTPSEDKIKKTDETNITNRDSIPRTVSKKSKELKSHDQIYLKGDAKFKNINVKVGGISKKTCKQKLVKKTQVKENIYTDVEYLNLEDFEP